MFPATELILNSKTEESKETNNPQKYTGHIQKDLIW